LILAPTQGFETASPRNIAIFLRVNPPARLIKGWFPSLARPSLESNIRVGPMGLRLEIYDKKKRGAGGAPAKIESARHSLFTLFALLFGLFLFQAGLILSNKRAEFRIVVFLAV
jgi:hypothetical protein